MKKFLAVLVSVVALLGFVAPAMAQAPAPKVTINGLVDFVASAYSNWSGSAGSLDATRTDNGWYTRERGVFTLTGEIGKSKGVWALELDFTNGAGLGVTSTAAPGTSANLDLDTDVAGFTETKWLYVETPVTGPGSLMPFIPVETIMRAGAQPFRGHAYKVGILASGDFPGVTWETTWAPNLRSTLTFAQIGEALDKYTAPGQNEDFAFLASVELDVFKGLTVKPTYAYAFYENGNCGSGNLGMEPKDGLNFNVCGTSLTPQRTTRRHTVGGDVRWAIGPITIQPTFLYQFGEQEIAAVANAGSHRAQHSVDINTFIFDTTAGFRTGPLNAEGRFMYTPGMGASQHVRNGADVGYYQAINPAFGYMAGWTEIQSSGVDYATVFQAGAPGQALRVSPSYDKYGRIFVAGAVDYSLTPALTLRGVANMSWTDTQVDTDSQVTSTGRVCTPISNLTGPARTPIGCNERGDASFIGTELNAGLTYRFAPNVAFDLIYAYMWTGDALSQTREAPAGSPTRCTSANQPSAGCLAGASTVLFPNANQPRTVDADDVWKAVARVRVTF